MTDPGTSPAGLITDVLAALSRLVRGEIALAKAEATRTLQDMSRAILRMVIAIVLGITAVNVLAGAAIAALVDAGMAPLWASLTVGGVLLLVAGGLMLAAVSLVRASSGAAKARMNAVRRDVETFRLMVTPDGPANNRT